MHSVAIARRKYRRRTQQPQSLTPIPEHKSCREWETTSSASSSSSVSVSSEKTRALERQLSKIGYSLMARERARARLAPLRHARSLRQLAQSHAHHMAQLEQMVHSAGSASELQQKLSSVRVGENIQRGSSMVDMHQICMRELEVNRSNVLEVEFVECGVGVARGNVDGKIYLVQYFR